MHDLGFMLYCSHGIGLRLNHYWHFYFKSAETILQSLGSDAYTFAHVEGHGFILKLSVDFKPLLGEIYVPLLYAD